MKNKSETYLLIENELFECEIGQAELYGYYNEHWEEIGVIDVIGLTEEKATIYGGVLVEIGGIEKLISFKLFNRWVYVYKDEIIEIMEDLGTEIIKVFYSE
ncbi:hypothetical protein vBSscSF1_48 [Staphylococcus phage vB-SscS-F1]|nr:hypothetical protein vBApySJF1_48 [Arcanobacterium phage vB-ApyS-JF1]